MCCVFPAAFDKKRKEILLCRFVVGPNTWWLILLTSSMFERFQSTVIADVG